MTAEIKTNLVPILSSHEYMGMTWLTIAVPNGWDDCKKLTRKVLRFNGENYTWRSWNSDKNECYFVNGGKVAEIRR